MAATHLSPAPGRQSRDIGKRSRSNGSGSGSDREQSLSKNRKIDDTGRVVEEESYCPASPAPSKTGLPSQTDSPIFKNESSYLVKPQPLTLLFLTPSIQLSHYGSFITNLQN